MKSLIKSPLTRYTIIDTIGEGSCGTVYRAYSQILKKEVAIKAIPNSAENEGWALNEGNIHAMIHHKNIIDCYEFWEDSDFVYIAMEYFIGVDMLDFVNERYEGLDEDEASVIIKQVIEAVIYLHSLKILHRDLKLENILIDDSLNVKVFDFGFAEYSEDCRFESVCGSPTYCAPEILLYGVYSFPADVYSVGICLYAMLHCCIPGSLNGLYTVPFKDFVFADRLSEDAVDLVSRLIAEDPNSRMSLKQVLKHPFITCDHDSLQNRKTTANVEKSIRESKSSYKMDELLFEDDFLSLPTIQRSASLNVSAQIKRQTNISPRIGERMSLKPLQPPAVVPNLANQNATNIFEMQTEFDMNSLSVIDFSL